MAGNNRRMKKFCITFFVLLILIATVLAATKAEQTQTEYDYLRIHVRANSNSQYDQDIKYKVKDEVVEFITPYISQCTTKQAAMEVISGITDGIEQTCDKALARLGVNYKSHAEVRMEYFPTRVYGDVTLEAGEYDALIVELGEGTGDNWWCVIYPPLCFTSATTDVEYRSIIYDIINKFYNR